MASLRNSRVASVAAGSAILVVLGSFGAYAAGQINSRDIENNSIRSVDIKNGQVKKADVHRGAVGSSEVLDGSLRSADLSDEAKAALKGDPGTVEYAGPNWSIVDRNVLGNGDAYLRSGPSSLGGVDAPYGVGSLGLRTGSASDKAAFGNQLDFAGLLIKDIKEIGFSVFTTAENVSPAGNNVPSIAMEIDPNVEAVDSGYSTLIYVPQEPDAAGANQWHEYDATTEGKWGLTGAKFAGTQCDINGPMCTWSEMQAYLNDGGEDAKVTYSVQITKGRDYAFSGAVDGLWINDDVYDFEPFGVIKR